MKERLLCIASYILHSTASPSAIAFCIFHSAFFVLHSAFCVFHSALDKFLSVNEHFTPRAIDVRLLLCYDFITLKR